MCAAVNPFLRKVIHTHKSQAKSKDGTKKVINEKLLDTKAKHASDKLFFVVYYTMTSIAWYYQIYDKTWLPWYLGGAKENVSIMSGFVNMPFTPLDEKLYFFGLFMLGQPL